MQLYSTQAKNVCSFVYALLCCKEWLLWIRAWGTAWGEIKNILLLFSLLYCCAATSTVARIPAQAYMFTSAGIEDVPYGNCWWISSSRLAMARSVELDRDLLFPGQQAKTVVVCLGCWHNPVTCKIPQSELAFVLPTFPCRSSVQAGHAWLNAARSWEGEQHKSPLLWAESLSDNCFYYCLSSSSTLWLQITSWW